MAPAASPPPDAVMRALAAGQLRYLSLRNDRLTVGLFNRLRSIGLNPIILKGASTRYWLDRPGRASADIDVWVRPGDRRRAERVLRDLGYARIRGVHADNWTSDDGPPVDLHRTLPRLRVSGTQAWDLLQGSRVTIDIAGGSIDVLDRPAHLVHLAIHATQDTLERSRDDLRRAASQADAATWTAAVRLSDHLGVTEVLAWALAREGLETEAAQFGQAGFVVNAPGEQGWLAFVRSPVHWRERGRRTLRVSQKWVVWNVGRAYRVVTLRSNRVQRMRNAITGRLKRQ